MIYVKEKEITQEEFEEYKTQLEEEQEIPDYNENIVFGYVLTTEDFILGGDELPCWPVLLDLEQQEIYELKGDNPVMITQEKLDSFELYAYEDREEDEIRWYAGGDIS